MKRIRVLAFSIIALAGTAAIAQADTRFVLREDFRSAAAIPDVLARSTSIPLNKRYADLDPEEIALLKSYYEHVGPDDEPPFPVNGIGEITNSLAKAQHKLLVRGSLYLIVDVSAAGQGTSVTAIGSPSPEMTKFAASVLLLTKFKPALCAGIPCAQKYPFHVSFRVRM